MPLWEDNVERWIEEVGPQEPDFLLDRIEEELDELKEAIAEYRKAPAWVAKKAELLKEMTDVVFTCNVFTLTMDWDFEGAYDELGESNLSKVIPDIVRRDDGKIMKGPNYMPPNMELFV